jgi:hypothetical protein
MRKKNFENIFKQRSKVMTAFIMSLTMIQLQSALFKLALKHLKEMHSAKLAGRFMFISLSFILIIAGKA